MNKLLSKRGQAFIWEVYLAAMLIGFGAYQVHQGKWGKNGSDALPLGPVETRSSDSGSIIKI